MLPIAAVSADVNTPLRRNDGKSAPLGVVARQEASGEMLRWQNMDVEIIGERNVRIPILFVQMRKVKSPCLKELADAERTDDLLDFGLQRHDGRVVEMIPMVVRHEEDVEFGNIRRRIDVAPAKGAVDEKDGRSVCGKDGIDENAPPRNLKIKGRVPHPYGNILLARDRGEICFIAWNKFLWNAAVVRVKENAPQGLNTSGALLVGQLVIHVFHGFEADELSVHIMRRLLDAFEARALRGTAEFFLRDEESRPTRERPDPREHAKQEVSAFHSSPISIMRAQGRAQIESG